MGLSAMEIKISKVRCGASEGARRRVNILPRAEIFFLDTIRSEYCPSTSRLWAGGLDFAASRPTYHCQLIHDDLGSRVSFNAAPNVFLSGQSANPSLSPSLRLSTTPHNISDFTAV